MYAKLNGSHVECNQKHAYNYMYFVFIQVRKNVMKMRNL